MKTYFIAGEYYDNDEDFNFIGLFSRLIEASSAMQAWDEVVIDFSRDGSIPLIKEIKVVE